MPPARPNLVSRALRTEWIRAHAPGCQLHTVYPQHAVGEPFNLIFRYLGLLATVAGRGGSGDGVEVVRSVDAGDEH
jgi:hypothetical protein